MIERHPDQIRAALAQGEAAAAVAKTFDRSVSPDIEGRTAAERVGRFLDVHEHRGGADRESIAGVASRRSNHETVELTVADLRELIRPEMRAMLASRAALAPLLDAASGDSAELNEPVDFTALHDMLAELEPRELDAVGAIAMSVAEQAAKARVTRARRDATKRLELSTKEPIRRKA